MDNEIRWLDHNCYECPGYIDDTFKTNDERYQIGEFARKYGYESALKELSKGWKALAEYMNVREQSYPSRIYRFFVEEDPHRFYRENIRRMQFEAPCFVDFDDEIVSHPSMFDWSVHRFARVLRKHLRKHERVFHSPLLSASGNPYWAVYRTGQKHRGLHGTENKFAGLAVFDVREILQGSWTMLWYVPDLIEYFDPEHTFFSKEDRRWAENNDEYVVWGFFPAESVLHWSSWEELSSPTIGLIRPSYTYWYTLGLFRRYALTTDLDREVFTDRLLQFACQILGEVETGSEVVSLAQELLECGNFGYRIKSSGEFTVTNAIDRRRAPEIQSVREEEGTEQGDDLNNAFSGLTLKE